MRKKPLRPDYLLTPYQLFEDASIQPLDRDVYAVVYYFEHMAYGECIASNNTIAELVKAEPRSVQNSLNRLEDAGFIAREYKDEHKRNRLRIIAKLALKYAKYERTTEDTRETSELQRIDERTTDDRAYEPQSTRIIKGNNKSNTNTATQSVADTDISDGNLVNKAIGGFKDVNPSYTRIFANKTQRAALSRLIKLHGVEKIEAIIGYLPKSNATKYAPTITTPLQLEARLGDLLAWAQKQKDTSSKHRGVLV